MRVLNDPLAELVCLVVDADAESSAFLAANLKGCGAKQVLTAGSGVEAFALLSTATRPVDLIISDVRMAKGNGLQLLQALRTGQIQGMRMNACLVLITDAATIGVIQAASALDANGFMVKPIAPDKFEATILKARRTVFPPDPNRHAHVYVPDEL